MFLIYDCGLVQHSCNIEFKKTKNKRQVRELQKSLVSGCGEGIQKKEEEKKKAVRVNNRHGMLIMYSDYSYMNER